MDYLFILGAVTVRGTYGVGYKLIAGKPPARVFNRWIVLFALLTYASFLPLCSLVSPSHSEHCATTVSWYGIASGASNTLACLVAFEAIRLVGVALSQVVAASVGISIGFLWGLLVYHQQPRFVGLCIVALVITVIGAATVAYERSIGEIVKTLLETCVPGSVHHGGASGTDVLNHTPVRIERSDPRLSIVRSNTRITAWQQGLEMSDGTLSSTASGSGATHSTPLLAVVPGVPVELGVKEERYLQEPVTLIMEGELSLKLLPVQAQESANLNSKRGWMVGCLLSAVFGSLTATTLMPEHFAPTAEQSVGYLPSLALGVAAAWGAFIVCDACWHFVERRSLRLAQGWASAARSFLLPANVETTTGIVRFIGGSAWAGACIGLTLVFFLVSIEKIGYGLSACLLQTSLVVSSLWGVILFREVDSATRLVIFFLGVACVVGGGIMLTLVF